MAQTDNPLDNIPRSGQKNPLDALALSSRNPLDDIPRTTGASAGPATAPAFAANPLNDIPRSGTTIRQPERQAPTQDPNAPWYEKTWDWANKPLVDLHREGATGFEAGAEDVASGFTSPLSIALALGTFGSGAALRALGVGAAELPLVLRGTKALMSAGLTATQVSQVIQESPRVLDALREGDYTTAKQLAVHVAAGTAFAALGGREAIKDVYSPSGVFRPAEQNAALRGEFGKYQGDIESGNRTAQVHKESLEEALPDDANRGAIYRNISAGGSRAKLIERYNAIAESAGREKLPAPQPLKVFHGTSGEVPDITALNPTAHGKPGVAGVGAYMTAEASQAGQYGQRGRVLAGVLSPDANLIDGNTPLSDALRQKIASHIGEVVPKDSTWLQVVNQVHEKAGAPERVAEEMNALQKVVAAEGYDGIRYAAKYPATTPEAIIRSQDLVYKGELTPESGVHQFEHPAHPGITAALNEGKTPLTAESVTGKIAEKLREFGIAEPIKTQPAEVIRRALMIFPEEVSGRPLRDLLRPTVPSLVPEPMEPQLAELAKRKLLADAPAKYVDRILGEYKGAMELSPEERAVADKTRQSYGEDFELAHSRGVLGNAIQNYANRLWEQDNPAARTITNAASNGRFQTNVSMARHRLWESETMGELLGHRLVSTDPVELSAWNKAQIRKTVAARDFLDRLRNSGLRASDGRQMVALSGTGEPITGDEAGSLANPFKIRNIRIPDALLKELQQGGDLQHFVADGTIIQRKSGGYSWNAGDYRTMEHPAFRGWNYATDDTAGNPVLVKGELRVHPEVFDQLKRYIGEETPLLGSSRIAKAVSGFSQESKRLLFSLSPFHLVQEHVRSFMAGINPFNYSHDWNIESNPVLRKGVEHGLTLNPEYKSSELFSEGMSGGDSKVIGKIPVLRDINQFIHHTIFERYIPSRKAAAFQTLVEQYKREYPKWEDAKVYEQAAAHTNELFGGINWRYLGRSARTQDFYRLASLSPDWTESNMRLIGRSLGPSGAVARKQLVKLAATMWVAARITNYLTSGQPHNETPFGVSVQDNSGKEHVYTLRSPLTDALHLAQDPRSFMLNRLSPAVKSGVEIAIGRDVRGRAVTPGDTALNAISNATPIPAQSALHFFNAEGPERDGFAQVMQSLGAENYVYRSQAEKLAGQLASNRAPSGPVDSAQLAKHLQKLRAEDELRQGQQPNLLLFDPNDRREIRRNARLTALQARFARLPMRDALEVWDAATASEKAELTQEFIKKKNAYVRKAYNERPEARAKDRTYRRLVQMFEDGGGPAPTSPTASSFGIGLQPLRE
jgi:hypothetical protein